MAKAHVISLGSINADFQVRVERRPEISETLPARDFVRLGGGKAANVAYLARKLGADVQLLGRVGDDDLAEQALKPLRELDVRLDGVKRVPQTATGVAMITVPPDGKKGIVLAGNANYCWSDGDIEDVQQAIQSAPANAVLVLDCEVSLPVVEAAARTAHERGLQVILDPSPADKVSDTLLSYVTVVTPNASETQQLTGVSCDDVDAAQEAGRRLIGRGAAAAAVKLPDGGCVLVEPEQTVQVTAVPVDVDDTTGAGDAFAGALAVALAEQQSRAEAVRLAVAASHQAVTGYGSQAVLPNREQLLQLAGRLRMQDVRI